MSDLVNCKRCRQVTGVTEEKTCATCGERICLFCGCSASSSCAGGCHWLRQGVCSCCGDAFRTPPDWQLIRLSEPEIDELVERADRGDVEGAREVVRAAYQRLWFSGEAFV